jgi:cell wall-associated NlpC family hydrolase
VSLGIAAVVASLLIGTPFAGAAPKLTLEQVEAKVTQLRHQAEQASEQYNETNEKLKSLQVRVAAAQARLAQQQAEVNKLKASLGKLAAELYRKGELSDLQLFLSDDPEAMLAQMGVVSSVSDRRDALLKRLEAGKKQLAQDTAALKRQEAAVRTAQQQLAAKRNEVNATLKAAEDQLSGLKQSEQRRLKALIEERDAKAVQKTEEDPPVEDEPVVGGTSVSCGSRTVTAPSERAAKAIRYACNQIGDPYVWAQDGPGSFDCSGLTMAAWKQAGVSLPHSSRQQASYGTRVSKSNLRPGDLVFFYSPISHVGLYIGKGLMVHAPSSGRNVMIAPLISSYATAVRL